MPPTRVLVVDDHLMVAEGITHALSSHPDIEVVGHATTVASALRLAAEVQPTVVVMDYRLPDGDGATATRQLRGEHRGLAVVMVTASDHPTVLAAALEAGCVGYVTKDRAMRDVVGAVLAAARGEVRFSASDLATVVSGARERERVGLTRRELELLQLLADGRSTADIADALVLSRSTVRNHVQSVLRKLGAHSKLEAVNQAVTRGIISHRS